MTTAAIALTRRFAREDILRESGIFIALIALLVVAAATVPQFATVDNAENILRSVSIIGVVAVGMTFVVIGGKFVDLTVPGVVALTSILALHLNAELGMVGVLVALLPALGVGLINGTMISTGANPVLVTLGVQTILAGFLLLVYGGGNVYGDRGDPLSSLGNASLGPVPSLTIVFGIVAVLGYIVLHRTRFGFNVFAVGSNPAAARVSGIRSKRLIVSAFVMVALMSGFAGVMIAAYASSSSSASGTGFEFQALTAVVLGGSSLLGGKGGMGRTVAGVLLIGSIRNVMILTGVQSEVQYLILGVLIVMAVSFDVWIQRRGVAA